jgi:hypothetical protein
MYWAEYTVDERDNELATVLIFSLLGLALCLFVIGNARFVDFENLANVLLLL